MISETKITGGKRVRPERLSNLVQQLRSGDRTVSDEIVKGHIGLAMDIARVYTRRSPIGKTDDIIAAAMLGLVQAVEWGARGRLRNNNIGPYIRTIIRRFVLDYVYNDHVIRIPRTTFARMQSTKTQPLVTTLDYRDDDDSSDNEGYDQYVELLYTEDEHDIIFTEIIDNLEFTDRERFVLDRLVEGFTMDDIAANLNTTKQNILFIKKAIRERISYSDLRPRHGRSTG